MAEKKKRYANGYRPCSVAAHRCLELQNIIFQQVGYMYKQKMISREAFKKFCQSKKTLEIAALSMVHTNAYQYFSRILIPVTALNEWTAENYRSIYEGEYEERILINNNYSLNLSDF